MSNFDHKRFKQMPIIGILRGFSTSSIQWVTELFFASGLNTIEITLNDDRAFKQIKELAEQYPTQHIGAGTVCSIDQMHQAIDVGAKFMVTPILNEKLVKKAIDQKVAIFPGALTPSEIYRAHEIGAQAIKIFPISAMGATYVKELLAPLPELQLIPVGGVQLSNIDRYLSQGAYGLGMGSGLFPPALILNERKKALQSHFEKIYRTVSGFLSEER